MKKLSALLLLLCCLAPLASAEEPAVGDEICGFRLVSADEIGLYHARLYTYEHVKTGAQVCHIANGDTNRCFAIGFHTPVSDDTGLPHVFEHAALGGSVRYPDPNLFFSMIYGTYSTYLNASTATTYTRFPTASLSEEQLLANMDVYLSGVFHPILLQDEHAMMREAYRYELEEPDGEITLQGVVYSEMLGAMTHERMTAVRLNRLLFPGSCVGSVSGGLPDRIPDMTYGQLCAFHEKYYTPSNSVTILYGDLQIGRCLRLLDEGYFSEYGRAETDLTDRGSRRMEGDVCVNCTFPVSADSQPETIVYYALPVEPMDTADSEILSIALNMLRWPDHLMDRRMNAELPECTWSLRTDRTRAGAAVVFRAKGLEAGQAELFRGICREAIDEALRDGFDPADLQVYADNARYQNATIAESADGVRLAESFIAEWDLTGDARTILDGFEIDRNIQDLVTDGRCAEVFRRAVASAYGSVLLVSETEPGGRERDEAARAERLAEMKRGMSAEEIDALMARTRDYAEWAANCAKESDLTRVTAVTVETLPEEVARAETATETADGLTVVSSPLEGTDYMTAELVLDASAVPPEALLPLRVWCLLAGDLATSSRDRITLVRGTERAANGLSIGLGTLENKGEGSWRPVFTISWNTFRDLAEESTELIRDILLNTSTEDLEYIRSALAADALNRRMNATSGAPHALAFREALRQTDEKSAYALQFSGANLIRYEERLAAMDDERLSAELQKGKDALAFVLCRDHAVLAAAGDGGSVAALKGLVREMLSDFPPMGAPADFGELLTAPKGNAACEIDTGVSYNMEFIGTEELGIGYSAALNAFSNLALDRVLLTKLRYENSVYSVFFNITEDEGSYLLTYRDPNLAKTFGEIFPALGADLKAEMKNVTQDVLDGYISSAYAEEAMPLGPIGRARKALSGALENRDVFGETLKNMRSLKEMKVSDLEGYAQILDVLNERGLKVTVTSPQKLREMEAFFPIVNTDYLK